MLTETETREISHVDYLLQAFENPKNGVMFVDITGASYNISERILSVGISDTGKIFV